MRQRNGTEAEDIVGRTPALARLLDQIEQVAATDSAVLVTGETGTGKELVAQRRAPAESPPRQAAGDRELRRAYARPSSKPNCSGTSGAPSPARRPRAPADSNSRTAARSSSTRLASCPRLAGQAAAGAAGRRGREARFE